MSGFHASIWKSDRLVFGYLVYVCIVFRFWPKNCFDQSIFLQKLKKAKKLASSKSGELFASAEEFAALMDDEEVDFNAGAIDQVISHFYHSSGFKPTVMR